MTGSFPCFAWERPARTLGFPRKYSSNRSDRTHPLRKPELGSQGVVPDGFDECRHGSRRTQEVGHDAKRRHEIGARCQRFLLGFGLTTKASNSSATTR